ALTEYGCRIIAISDISGGYFRKEGLDIADASQYAATHRGLEGWDGGEPISNEQLLVLPCTVLIPAALARVITKENASALQCRILRSEEHTSELQSRENLVCRLLLEKKNKK